MNRFLQNNLYVKIFALFLAVVLWLYVVNEQSPRLQRTFTVKLETRDVASGLVITNAPAFAEVRVSGLRNNVLALTDKDVKAYLDLRGINEGEYFLPVKVQIPRSVELLQVKPDKVKVELEKIVSKTVAVRPQIKGAALGQYAVVGATAQDQEALVVGPRSKVEETVLIWAVVNLDQIRGANNAQGRLVPIDHEGQLIKGLEIKPKSTLVTIPTLPVRELPVKARLKGSPAVGFVVKKVVIEPWSLRVAGSDESLGTISALETENIDLTGLDSNLQKEVVVTIPEGVTLVDRNRVKVQVVVGPGEGRERFSQIPVNVENLPENWQAKVNPEKVDIWVRGSKDVLDEVKREDIKVIIDAANIEKEGEVSLAPKILLPPGLTFEKINPEEILLNLKKNN